ncbi:MAG: hypothetical protein ABMA15_03430 [Vicinamibacterales bacterium]
MLQRVSADRFSTPTGESVQLVLRSSRNNGTNGGEFHYAGQPLNPEVIQTLPGCTFVPIEGVEQFRVNVEFDPDAPNARYDLFEIDQVNGAQVDLNEHRLASDPDGIIGFGIVGVAVAVRASPGTRAKEEMQPPARKAAATKKAVTKKRRSATRKKPVQKPATQRKQSSQTKRRTRRKPK